MEFPIRTRDDAQYQLSQTMRQKSIHLFPANLFSSLRNFRSATPLGIKPSGFKFLNLAIIQGRNKP